MFFFVMFHNLLLNLLILVGDGNSLLVFLSTRAGSKTKYPSSSSLNKMPATALPQRPGSFALRVTKLALPCKTGSSVSNSPGTG